MRKGFLHVIGQCCSFLLVDHDSLVISVGLLYVVVLFKYGESCLSSSVVVVLYYCMLGVLTPCRSSLSTRTVEALLCTQSWLRKPIQLDLLTEFIPEDNAEIEEGNVLVIWFFFSFFVCNILTVIGMFCRAIGSSYM